jgi:SH3-like domain-containing protein
MLKYVFKIILVFTLISVMSPIVRADETVRSFRSTDLPLPRFVSLRSNKVYARTGPSLRYPIKWIYQRESLPMEITQEYDTWRKIRDFEGHEGWIHQSLLTGERTALIVGETLVSMREGYTSESRLAARLEPGVVARIQKCTPQWCKLEAGGYHGWVERRDIWGIYENEDLN